MRLPLLDSPLDNVVRDNHWHAQTSPGHGAVLGVRCAEGGLGRHGREEDRRAWNGQVGPKAPLSG
eukprot:15092307-Alexandrium_andersonii.AAC.1